MLLSVPFQQFKRISKRIRREAERNLMTILHQRNICGNGLYIPLRESAGTKISLKCWFCIHYFLHPQRREQCLTKVIQAMIVFFLLKPLFHSNA